MRRRRARRRIVGQAAARARVLLRPGIAVRRGQRLGDVGAGAEAGIDKAERLQPLERGGIKLGALRLDDRRAVDRDPEPVEVLGNAVNEFCATPARIKVLNPEQEALPARAAKRGRIGMAKMEAPRRRRRKACDLQDLLPCK